MRNCETRAHIPPICNAVFLFALAVVSLCRSSGVADEFPVPVNTQAAGEHPPAPRDMLELFELPPGFNVTLFAGEPDVRQPIAFDFDDRGRIWVAENYSYGAHGTYDPDLRDRIIILHDTDGDGEHDERTVFWDQGWMLTGLTWGFGGMWVLNDGTLSFIPDRDGDDVPDSAPIEMLNGWTKNAGHNFVSGLLWGPDGWLYGRHGITDTSYPGTPDTPQAERAPMNCGIWRFHPTRHTFEVVCHGTTNPWGLDYNETGDMFMTNNVIGHLWHVIPGAHYERMFGQDFNPHLYELMGQTADHYHWDSTGKWSESRDGKADDLGGGHSHCGGMIYLGNNFPEEYRGKMFMCNTHGRCVNVDRLERHGSGYVAKHEPNFLKVNTPWFRGVELKYGPRGCVYLTDWSDNGECHDHDGVHRTSGRIYRIAWGRPESGPVIGKSADTPAPELHQLAIYGPEWTSRRARRRLQEQGYVPDPGQRHDDPIQALRGAWLLAATEHVTVRLCEQLLDSDNEHLRYWAVRLAGERPSIWTEMSSRLSRLALNEGSFFVLSSFASAMPRLSAKDAQEIALLIAGKNSVAARIADDDNLTLLLWYGMVEHFDGGSLSASLKVKKLRQFTYRRMAVEWRRFSEDIENLLETCGTLVRDDPTDTAKQHKVAEILAGLLSGTDGLTQVPRPAAWDRIYEWNSMSPDPEIRSMVNELAVLVGEGRGLTVMREFVKDSTADPAARTRAVRSLAAAQDTDSVKMFLSLLNDRAVYADVAKALATFDDARIPEQLLRHWNNLRHGARDAAIDTMVSRRSNALELAKAIDDGRIDSADLTATHVRQLLSFHEPSVTSVIEARWGVINDSSAAIAETIAGWKKNLTPEVLAAADLENGAALFKKSCAACHKLYGEGGTIGPDLTGANRGNMDYMLGNVVDPSAVVPKQFTVSVIALNSGRIISGVVVAETESTVTIQTDKEALTVAVAEIEERTRTTKSLMPDGLLDPLTAEQVRDLFAFVMKRR